MPTATKLKTDTKEKVEAKPDVGLLKLFNDYDGLQVNTGKKFAAIVTYLKKNNVARPILKATLMKRGLKEGSANVECTRLFKLMQNADLLAAYERGDVSVRAVRKGVAVPRGDKTLPERVYVLLEKAAHLAYGTEEFESLSAFTDLSEKAWGAEVTNAKAAEEAASGGSGETDTEATGEGEAEVASEFEVDEQSGETEGKNSEEEQE